MHACYVLVDRQGLGEEVGDVSARLHPLDGELPLSHAVELVRPLMNGAAPAQWGLHLCVLAVYAMIGFYFALALTRRRLLK